jgi:hypothetical protein
MKFARDRASTRLNSSGGIRPLSDDWGSSAAIAVAGSMRSFSQASLSDRPSWVRQRQ